MSARLSRRFGTASYYPPLLGLPATEKLALSRRTEERHAEFEDLPERHQRLILAAEANLRRHQEAIASGRPEALGSLWPDKGSRRARPRSAATGRTPRRRCSAPRPAQQRRTLRGSDCDARDANLGGGLIPRRWNTAGP